MVGKSVIKGVYIDMSDFKVEIDELAAERFKEHLVDNGLDTQSGFMRLYVSGGGCSGLSYGLQVSEEMEPDDEIVLSNGVRILVDPASAKYVNGSVIQYVDDVLGGGFKVVNPNSIGGCGCGSSFSVEGEEPKLGGCNGCGHNE